MDARVPQSDGFRFFYVLPFDEHRVLVDTYFPGHAELDFAARELDVIEYARRRLRVARVVRREHGVLPMPTRFKGPLPPRRRSSVATRRLVHPATAYSFPVALRLALHVGRHWDGDLFGIEWARLVSRHRKQVRFATWLNRMLFGVFRPETRYGALERFYRSSEATIERFYALETTRLDRFHLVCGRPPRGLALPALTARRMAS